MLLKLVRWQMLMRSRSSKHGLLQFLYMMRTERLNDFGHALLSHKTPKRHWRRNDSITSRLSKPSKALLRCSAMASF